MSTAQGIQQYTTSKCCWVKSGVDCYVQGLRSILSEIDFQQWFNIHTVAMMDRVFGAKYSEMNFHQKCEAIMKNEDDEDYQKSWITLAVKKDPNFFAALETKKGYKVKYDCPLEYIMADYAQEQRDFILQYTNVGKEFIGDYD